MSFWQKAIWSNPDNMLQHVCCGECWIFTLQIQYSAVCKHINIFYRCTVVHFTMQAHSVSLTFTNVNKGTYGDARRTKQFSCLCITSKATSDKRQEFPVLLGGKPVGGKQEMAGKDKWTDFCTDQQNGQVDWQKASIWLDIREGRGQDLWVNRWIM